MKNRCPIVLDIETVGQDWESLPTEVQNYLLERAKSEEKREQVPDKLGLHPATGRIITIGLWDPQVDRGYALTEGSLTDWVDLDHKAKIMYGPEPAILTKFWEFIGDRNSCIVTFNGRAFDAPYLMIRSAILGVEPTRNLMPYRYSFQDHCDLAEVLSFWNSRRPEGTLDFWCRQFGIDSPKTHLSGADVAIYYKDGKLEEIARYCLADVRATSQLYVRLSSVIKLLDRNHPSIWATREEED